MAKTSFTNADLDAPRRGERGFQEPEDIVGPWRTVGEPKQSLGAMSAEGGSIDDILRGAHEDMGRFDQTMGRINLEASGNTPTQRPNAGLEFADEAGSGALGAALPMAGMVGGPVGALAGLGMAGESAYHAAQDPSVGNLAGAAIGGLLARWGLHGAGGRGITGLKGLLGRGKGTAVRGEIPYRHSDIPDVRGRMPQPSVPVKSSGRTHTVERFGEGPRDVVPGLDRTMANVPAAAQRVDDAAGALPFMGDDAATAAQVNRMMPNAPAASHLADEGAAALPFGNADDLTGLVDPYMPNVPASTRTVRVKGLADPNVAEPSVVDRFMPNSPASSVAAADDAVAGVDDRSVAALLDRYMPNQTADAAESFGEAADTIGRAPGRLDDLTEGFRGEFTRQRGHGIGGFSGLPELSPAESSRIAALIERITGK